MLFSLIIPCYNVEAFLAECLDSVLSQSFDDWEAICVNDGSTDGTGVILADYATRDARIRVLTQPNAGLSVARNAGIAAAKGDFLLFLDSDDVLTSGALAILAKQKEETKAEVLTFNAELWFFEEKRFAPHYYSRYKPAIHASGTEYLIAFVRKHGWGPAAVCFYCVKRSIFERSELHFQPGLLHEDELFVPEMLLATSGPVVEIPVTLYHYRMRSTSITHTPSCKNAEAMFYIASTLEGRLSATSLPKDVCMSIVHNNAKLGIATLLSIHERVPLTAFRLAWRNATWKRKIKLLRLMCGR